MHAVAVAVVNTPPFAPLEIVTDSKYVIQGLTQNLPGWEDRGWIGLANADVIKNVVARLRGRSAPTTFRWVKGHSGVLGNEEADKLASAAVAAATNEDAQLLPPPPHGFVADGARLESLSQKLAYTAIMLHGQHEQRRASVRMVERIQATLKELWGLYPTEAELWNGIRKYDTRRTLRDFWWKAMHGALRVGEFWDNIPGYEQRATCTTCGVPESLEHIVVDCEARATVHTWELVHEFLRMKGIAVPVITFGAVMASPILSMKGLNERTPQASDRFLRIVLTEAVHLIWKLRCERVISTDYVPETAHTRAEVRARLLEVLNRRLLLDQYLTARRLKKRALCRELVIRTWCGVLQDEKSLPDDWIFSKGVLVGMPGTRRLSGVG
ncbi:RnaseH-domain-containing protein [Trametes sanguinea]|nr:RnaseH-domain-containing protein [Trametes sanguinea]